MSSSLSAYVSMFQGKNFLFWREQMADWLRSQSLYGIAQGTEAHPEFDDPATAAQMAIINNWNNRNEMCLGTIQLRLSDPIKASFSVTEFNSAYALWKELNNWFSKPSNTQKYTIFSELINVRLTNPAKIENDLAHLEQLSLELKSAGIEIPDYLLALITLHALPANWSTMVAMLIQSDANLQFGKIRQVITQENQRRTRQPGSTNQTAQKLSTVKRKGNNPPWKQGGPGNQSGQQQQPQQQNNAPQPQQQNQQGDGKKKWTRKRGDTTGNRLYAEFTHLC